MSVARHSSVNRRGLCAIAAVWGSVANVAAFPLPRFQPPGTNHLSRAAARPRAFAVTFPPKQQQPQCLPHLLVSRKFTAAAVLHMASEPPSPSSSAAAKRPFFLDPGTKGGALVLMFAMFAVPLAGYQFMVTALDYDEIEAGIAVGMGFTILSTLAWMSTYLFRVATKDMTYVRTHHFSWAVFFGISSCVRARARTSLFVRQYVLVGNILVSPVEIVEPTFTILFPFDRLSLCFASPSPSPDSVPRSWISASFLRISKYFLRVCGDNSFSRLRIHAAEIPTEGETIERLRKRRDSQASGRTR